MQPGQLCRLRGLEDWVWRPPRSSSTPHGEPEEWLMPLVLGYVVGVQPHTEEPDRLLFFFHTVQLVLLWASNAEQTTPAPDTPESALKRHSTVQYRRYHPPSAATHAEAAGELHRGSDVHMTPQGFTSADGYAYKHDGWYDAEDLEPLTEELVQARYGIGVRRTVGEVSHPSTDTRTEAAPTRPISLPQAWLTSMDAASACCEVRYLCFAFRPWFATAFESLPYLALPERQLCYSAHLCHRCLTPFFSLDHLCVHLEGYCPHGRRPPGPLLYSDRDTGRKIYFVDGAQHLHYGRCLSLIGKGFIESKRIRNDVDIYEFFVVTIPRHTIPFVASTDRTTGEMSESGDNVSPEVLIKPEPVTDGEAHVAGASSSNTQEARAFRAFVSRYDAEAWDGDVVVGYFSRLKHQPHHALSCIMTLPCFQRMRLGSFMLDAAYYFAHTRQEQCGCRAFCGVPEEDGASISRPFSPHGQALLIAYWRRTVLQCLWRRCEAQQEVPGTVDGDATHITKGLFTIAPTLDELRRWLPIPVSLADLQFLFLQSDFAFYAPSSRRGAGSGSDTEGTSMGSGTPRHRTLSLTSARSVSQQAAGATSTSSAQPASYDFSGTLVFDASEVSEQTRLKDGSDAFRRLPGSFDRAWLRRLPDGQLVYNRSLFHH